MRAGELCVRDVATAAPDESVVVAARRMAEYGVGDLVIVEEAPGGPPKPIAIVTDRDLVLRVLTRTDLAPAETPLAEVMQRDLVTANEDEDIEGVLAKMRGHGVRRLPILDSRGGLQGLLTLDDVLGWMRDQLQAAAKLLERQADGPLHAHAHTHAR